MKSKLIILSLALAGTVMSVSAQSTRERYTSEGGKNFFVSATGGISMINTGKDGGFGDVAPHVTVSVGKWFNPVIGLRAQGGGWQAKYNSKYNFVTEAGAPTTERSYKEKVAIARLDVLYSLTNAILGYNPDRWFNLSAFAGPGLTFSKTFQEYNYVASGNGYRKDFLDKNKFRSFVNGSVGLLANFYVSDAFSIDVEARGELATSYLSATSTARSLGGLYFGAGLTYTFGGREFMVAAAKVDNTALNDEINRLHSQIEDLRNRPAQVREVEKIVEVKGDAVFNKTPIFFKIGSYRLDNYAKATIKLVADGIKAMPGKTFKISAYADKATGSVSFNQKLTENRAQAVYDALVAEGVPSSQLQIVANGGVDNLFGNNQTTRVVIMGVD